MRSESIAQTTSLSTSLGRFVLEMESSLGGLDEPLSQDIYLISKEGREFKTNRAACVLSKHLVTIMSNDQDENRIELTNVSSDVLKTIISYMTYHTTNGRTPADIKEIAKPIRSLEMRKLVEDSFDADLADGLTYKQIFDTILAANYMQIDPLLHLLCAKTATMIKNKSHDEIRTIFVDGTGSKATAQPGASS